jgi:hypothetical protein
MRIVRPLSAIARATAWRIHRPLLDQVEERQPLVAVALRDRDDETQVCLDHRLLRGVLAALDPLRQFDFLRGGEQRDAPDVLQEELQRVSGDLGLGLKLELRLLLFVRMHDLDLRLVQRRVELVHLARVEVELVERERDLLGVEPARAAAGLEERACFVRFENALDSRWGATGLLGLQVDPPSTPGPQR